MKPRRELYGQTALRGGAAVVVFIAHALYYKLFPQYPWVERAYRMFFFSDEAVDLFFELSGFILCYVYMQKKFLWRDYFLARFARIYPLYIVALITLLLLGFYDLRAGRGFGATPPGIVLANIFLVQQWPFVPYFRSINFPTWSISVEMFLYVVIFPALCFLHKRLTLRLKIALTIVPVILFVAMICYEGTRESFWGPLLFMRGIVDFVSGFFTCSIGLEKGFPKVISRRGEIIFLTVIASCLLFQFPFNRPITVLGIPLLAYLAAQDASVLTRVVAGKFFNWLGDISYSLYVWHWPVLLLLTRTLNGARNLSIVRLMHLDSPFFYIFVSIVAVFTVSHVSHFYFERPVNIRLRKGFGSSTSAIPVPVT